MSVIMEESEGGGDGDNPTHRSVIPERVGDYQRRRSVVFVSKNVRPWLPNVGAFAAFFAVFIMSFSDVIVAIISAHINSIQICLIYAVGVIISSVTALLLHFIKDESILRRSYSRLELRYLLLCAVFNTGGLTLFIASVRFIPVGDATAIFRTMPVMAAILGRIFLGQRLRCIDALFIVFCIVGVTVIARPSFIFHAEKEETAPGNNNKILGISFALASAVCFASIYMFGTKLSEYKIPADVIMSLNALVFLLLIAAVWSVNRQWDCFQTTTVALCLLAGAITGIGQLMVFWAVTKEKLVVVTVILASNVIFSNVLQILLMHIMPHWISAMGAGLVLTSCVGMALRKNETGQEQSNKIEERSV